MKFLRRTKKSVAARNIEAGEASARSSPQKTTVGVQTRSKTIPTPQFRAISQDPPTSGPVASSPPSSSGPPPKKQKTSQELASFNDKDFDALGWIEQHILPQTFISTDDVSMEHHFQYMARSCVRMASLHAAIAREFKKSPIGATSSRLEKAQSEFERISELKAARITELEASLEKEKAKATAAVAAANASE